MADPGEAWELWQLDFSGGGNWEEQLVDLAHHLEQEVDGAKLGGVFSSVFGPIKVIVLIKFGINHMGQFLQGGKNGRLISFFFLK